LTLTRPVIILITGSGSKFTGWEETDVIEKNRQGRTPGSKTRRQAEDETAKNRNAEERLLQEDQAQKEAGRPPFFYLFLYAVCFRDRIALNFTVKKECKIRG